MRHSANDKGGDLKRVVREANRRLAELRQAKPDEIGAFGTYLKLARAEGALSAKTKELMNLAIALVVHCIPCIIRHTKMSLEMGATREEILETALVAIGMGGGLTYAQTVYMLEALDTWAPGDDGSENA